jgi:hypothetical protein
MNRIYCLFFLLLSLSVSDITIAQTSEYRKDKFEMLKVRLKKAPKVYSFGWSVIDDNGRAYVDILAPKSFNTNIIPLTFNYDVHYGGGMFFNIKSSFCNFGRDRLVNGVRVDNPRLLFGLDFNLSFSLNAAHKMSNKLARLRENMFDFRLVGGIGYTNRNIYVFDHSMNLNAGGLVYARFSKNIGMYMELLGKLGLKAPLIRTNSNYMHATIGISYFIGAVKYYDPSSNFRIPNTK